MSKFYDDYKKSNEGPNYILLGILLISGCIVLSLIGFILWYFLGSKSNAATSASTTAASAIAASTTAASTTAASITAASATDLPDRIHRMNLYFNQMITQNMNESDTINRMKDYINQMIQNMNENDTAMVKTYANRIIGEYMTEKEVRNKK